MVQRHYVHDPDTATWIEVSDRVDKVGWEVRSAAEEGTTPIATMSFDDPAMDFDIVGHRRYLIVEDESDSADDVLWAGYTAEQEISRGEGDDLQPLGRVWSVSISDENTVWQRRIMRGSDCKRPGETDVERMQWLLSTAEAGFFDDVATYVSTADPVDMDGCDYRNQMFNGIADDCAQQSGKNWFAMRLGAGTASELFAWYGDGVAEYTSPLSLSNDPTDWVDGELADGSSLVWPISMDTKLNRDPSRVFSGVEVPYDGGSAYVESTTTAAAYARRDTSMPAVNVKTKAAAERRGRRYLRDLDEQDETIATTVELPRELATQIKAGMVIPFKATHLPGLSDFVDCRVLMAAPTPIAAGERYRIALELAIPKSGDEGSGGAPVYAVLWYGHGAGYAPITWFGSGDEPPSGWTPRPTVGLVTPMELGTSGHYDSIRIDGDGTIDVTLHLSTIGVFTYSKTAMYMIFRSSDAVPDGEIVASGDFTMVTGDNPSLWRDTRTVTVSDLPVSSGNMIYAKVFGWRIAFFRTPAGVGNLEERLEITGGSLS